ncbi:tetratricopeptide repeat protein [Bradyrhizobium sp. HKCCYLS3077]|uniref:tetratricopeptide repeat protein n=1 Tax=Bradyrhizobium sp. HKCCYLS3077 TaxID=3420761 RepID=UPI003EBF8C88
MQSEQHLMDRAHALLNRGNSVAAAELYRELVVRNPDDIDALHFLGVAEATAGHLARAKPLLDRAVQSRPVNPDFVENYATVLHRAGDYDGVIALCRRFPDIAPNSLPLLHTGAAAMLARGEFSAAIDQLTRLLERHPSHFPAHAMLGSALARTRQYQPALEAYARAARLNPLFPDIHLDQGTIHLALGQPREALAAYERVIATQPEHPAAWAGRCFALIQLGRGEEALAAADRARALQPGLALASVAHGDALLHLDRLDEAESAYRRATEIEPEQAAAWTGLGHVALKAGQHKQAQAAFERALAIDATWSDAWLGQGLVLLSLGDHAGALAPIDRSLELSSHVPAGWRARGQAAYLAKRFEEALRDWTRSLQLNPDQRDIVAARLRVKMHLCDWTGYEAAVDAVRAAVRDGAAIAPFMFVAIPSTPAEQLQCARQWVARNFRPANAAPTPLLATRLNDRIRLGYVSADFHEHATSQLLAGVIEHHDRSRFEVTAISLGPDDGGPMRQRLRSAFEHFIDAREMGDGELAELILGKQIDILVDLKGYTQGARTGLFALRPAPIQVSYLGFPGTIGADFIDYIIADAHVIPDSDRPFYAEKVAWLPHSYQANDDRRFRPGADAVRRDHGLPDDAFVFCCFNDNYKITPEMFDSWMRILRQIERGVLWLFEDNPVASTNLRKEAAARGIAPERLVFARHVPPAQHLARLHCADLVLDTLPYAAHTTASDALWAGVPLLTQTGPAFAGRVGTGLLHAVGLPELVTTDQDQYEQLAVQLASSPNRLATLRNRLANALTVAPLFDTRHFTRDLEGVFTAMVDRHAQGITPNHLTACGSKHA